MANTLPTVDDITLSGLDVFENTLVALKKCSRKHEGAFGQRGGKIGDTRRIRKPAQFTVRSGQAWAGQNIEEQYDTLTINYQKGIDFSMSSVERRLDLNSMTDQILKPALVRLPHRAGAAPLYGAPPNASRTRWGRPGPRPARRRCFWRRGGY